jgi:hypothetical protein
MAAPLRDSTNSIVVFFVQRGTPMELPTIFRTSVGLDVHQAKISACAMIEQPDGSLTMEHREFGAFKKDRRALAEWVRSLNPDVVVMESTGIYWKSPYGV